MEEIERVQANINVNEKVRIGASQKEQTIDASGGIVSKINEFSENYSAGLSR